MKSRSLLRIALLGADTTTSAMVHAIHQRADCDLVGTCEIENLSDPRSLTGFDAAVERTRRFDSWEALLDLEVVDAVVVARGPNEDQRAEQLRKLIQAGVPLLVSHPVVDSMLVYYELDMIRRETGSVVLPLLYARHHPAAKTLTGMVRQGAGSPLGTIDQLVMQRAISVPTKAAVAQQFARDVDLIRAVAGDMTRLGAMAGAGGDAAYGSLGVQMSGSSGVAARWSVIGSQAAEGTRLTLIGSNGQATIAMGTDGGPWMLELTTQSRNESQTFGHWDPAAAALAGLAAAVLSQPACVDELSCEPAHPDWVDASRSVELAETIDRSLHKGRTIELYYEDYSEAGTFKGTMASLGCGLLLLGLFLMGAVAIVEQIMGVAYTRFWPYLLAGLLGLFLLLQFLLLVSRRKESPPPNEAPESRPPH